MFQDGLLNFSNQLPRLDRAVVSLPLAAIFSAALAFRPRRRSTPPRDSEVIHTQIILGIVGALVMLVIGESLARAFGIVGAAGLIRYRARIKDAKDAGVMLATLGMGLACGVGLYLLACFATVFLLIVLWFLESHAQRIRYKLKVLTRNPAELETKIEQVLSGHRVPYQLRTGSDDELEFETQVLNEDQVQTILSELKAADPSGTASFAWRRQHAE